MKYENMSREEGLELSCTGRAYRSGRTGLTAPSSFRFAVYPRREPYPLVRSWWFVDIRGLSWDSGARRLHVATVRDCS